MRIAWPQTRTPKLLLKPRRHTSRARAGGRGPGSTLAAETATASIFDTAIALMARGCGGLCWGVGFGRAGRAGLDWAWELALVGPLWGRLL